MFGFPLNMIGGYCNYSGEWIETPEKTGRPQAGWLASGCDRKLLLKINSLPLERTRYIYSGLSNIPTARVHPVRKKELQTVGLFPKNMQKLRNHDSEKQMMTIELWGDEKIF
ncbi:MAG TPA: hypothetical protein DDY32_11395 [Desulfobulbaceae bacterium]|nr:hypothetical protein [Desulfobulbaceae bacterium]